MVKTSRKRMVLGMFIGAFLIFFSFSAPTLAEEVPQAAMAAAEQGLLTFLEAIPTGELGNFNFANQTELDEAELGNPFMIYTIYPDDILNYEAGTDVESIITPTDVWLFPVVSNDKIRTLLTVDFVEGNWRAVSIGGSGVAKQWASITASSASAGASQCKFVRVYQALADFVLISDLGETKMVPLESARISLEHELKLEREGPYDPSEIIFGLQEPVRQNVEVFKDMEGE